MEQAWAAADAKSHPSLRLKPLVSLLSTETHVCRSRCTLMWYGKHSRALQVSIMEAIPEAPVKLALPLSSPSPVAQSLGMLMVY